jgi:surfactin synthase thioesterase subunit
MYNPTQHNSHAPTPWLPKWRPKAGVELRLFCFPYAGGTAFIYRNWQALLPPSIEVCPVELPGRGVRIGEPAQTRLESLVAAMAPALAPYMDCPFAFFGHSMGGLLSFELARELRRSHRSGPVHIFISACPSPHRRRSLQRITYNLPEPEFVEELRRLGGTPPEVLEHPELAQLMLPLLRADFEVCQTYKYTPESPLDCPLTIFGGLQDGELSRSELEEWREYTTSTCVVRMLAGEHFFINTAQHLLLPQLDGELHAYVR